MKMKRGYSMNKKNRTKKAAFRRTGALLCLLLAALLCVLSLSACTEEEPPVDVVEEPDPVREGTNSSPDLRDDYKIPTYTDRVAITLKLPDHCSLMSENPVVLKRGEDAVFKIFFHDNYVFSSSPDGLVFENGNLVLTNCTEDATVTFHTAKATELYSFGMVAPDPEDGSAISTVRSGSYLVGQQITVRATVSGHRTFLGWSNGATVVNGGTMVSFSKDYTFSLSEDTMLYPNFLVAGYTVITYNLNGGVLADDGMTPVVQTQFDRSVRLCPNLTPDIGSFVRDGYTLLEYTENADGSGQAVCPGGIAVIDDTAPGVVFYAQWSKWTPAEDFSYTTDGAAVRITKYNGDADVLSIPAKIGGLPVISIAAGAVDGKNFETLVVPSSVKAMDAGAFRNCKKFNTLYITDSFTAIPDSAFQNCNKFANLRLGAAELPHYPINAESVATRMEQIIKSDPSKPTIVLVGGSSCLYGIYSPILEAGLGNRYNIINAGTNAGGTGLLYMEGLSHYMKEGDLFVNVPELGANQMGGVSIVWRTFRATEGCYNLYRYVDFTPFTTFFSAMSEFNTSKEARGGNTARAYEITNTSLSETYCDLAGTANGTNTYERGNKPIGVVSGTANTLNVNMINNYARLYEKLTAKGIGFYFSYPPIMCLSDEYRAANPGAPANCSDANLLALHDKEVQNFPFPVISDPRDYRFYETDYFNSNYHLTAEAARVRTARLLADLKAQLIRDGLPVE